LTHEHPTDHEPPDEELVPADDAIIGKALRGSLIVAAGIAVVVAAILLLLNRPRDKGPGVAMAAAIPMEVERELTPPPVVWTDVTAEAGIDFVHVNGAAGEKLLPETMGSGAAFFDYDNDGDQDLLLVNSTYWPHGQPPGPSPTSALYRNDGSGHFDDATRETGLALSLYGTGVAVGDYDNDGWVDLFLSALGRNRLLRNLGGRFREVTREAGVGGEEGEWSTSAAFLDYDNDGDLDLFVANYVSWSPEIDREIDYRLTGVGRAYGPPLNYEGTFPYLYRNQGDGTFRDVSASSGVQVRNPATGVPVAKALGIAPADVDGDGRIDLLVANDTVRNFFFHNQGDGTFVEAGELFGLAYGRAGEATGAMGVDAGYYRNDPELGFAVGNFANEMTLLYTSQEQAALYFDEAIVAGIGAPSRLMLSFGMLFFDYDLDGRLDLLQTNGHLENEINTVDPSQSYEQPCQLFWNSGPEQARSFVLVDSASAGDLARPLVGRGSAYADIDGDGDLDVVLTQVGRRPLVLRNDQDLGHHWLRVTLRDRERRRDAIGARIELVAGGVTQRRQVMPTRGYQSQSELPVTFGLGTAERVDALVVRWPDGTVQRIDEVTIDQLIVLTRP